MTSTRTKGRWRFRGCAAVAVMAFSGAATAEFIFNPYASGQFLYDSNVYRFSQQVANVTGTTDTGDHIQRYGAGLDTVYNWSQQKLYAVVEGRSIRFNQFQHLDHNEYLLSAGLDGGILSNTTGMLNFRDERRMASFEDRRSTRLIIERDRVGRGALRVAVTPEWYVVAGGRSRNLHTPLPAAPALPQPAPGASARNAAPDFTVHETAFNLGVQYGVENKSRVDPEAPLLLGVMLEHQDVTFSGVTPQPAPPPGVTRESFDGYRLLSLQATAEYAVSDFSIFDAELGLTQYNPRQSNDKPRPELTGEIGYTRALTEVTEVNAHLFRRIATRISTAEATADAGVSVGAKWEPIRDLKTLLNYAWSSSSFEDSSSIASENSGRSDKQQSASISVAYPLFRRFGLRLFGTYSDRNSSLTYNNYTDKTGGIELSFRWRIPE